MDRHGEILNLAALEKRVAAAILDLEGVAGPRMAGGRLLHLPGYPRVLIRQDRSGSLEVRVRVRAWFGADLHHLSDAVQGATRSAIGHATSRTVSTIDIRFARLAARRALLDDARQGRTP